MRNNVSEITGAILAGGKSRRFGSNKALIQVNGVPVIQRIRDQLSAMCQRVVVITNTPEEFVFLGLPIATDIFPGRGPLGGLHTALEATYTEWIVVTPCDLPFFSYNLVHVLARYTENSEVVCFTNGGTLEPLPALFSRSILKKLCLFMQSGNYTLQAFLDTCKIKKIPLENFMDRVEPRMLLNCNTIEDYKKFVINGHNTS